LPENGKKLREILDEKNAELAEETDPVERDRILGEMIKQTGYRIDDHCNSEPLFRLRVTMTLSGFGAAILALAYGLWWIIQREMGG
jgi:hypothetical protein